ncbi:hypothetical protein CHS0354_029951 [Potamilus streckersoni]|uniref:Kyphoscoliosis peptidase n=1 Tax=Potamilus streckersoni TaxID=2493646 RepID=A0AAE0VJG4_9BIVA|nr:hypothetical protein CHS0354_029951 [Potamilus streckersoni]
MGAGISTYSLCGSDRSVLIPSTARKLPPIPENDMEYNIEMETEIKPSSGKLHPADSRDSGIGENDIPSGLLLKRNGKHNDFSNGNNKVYDGQRDVVSDDDLSARPSRPRSCRLGHRGASHRSRVKHAHQQKAGNLPDSQIRRIIQHTNVESVVCTDENFNEKRNDLDSSDNEDTLSNKSSSPQRDARPKSARRKLYKRSTGHDGVSSARTISDLDSSTDTDISDTDMLSIPDETGNFQKGNTGTPRRRGWVRTDDFTEVTLSTSFTPRSGSSTDFYRIRLDDLVNCLVTSLKKHKPRGLWTQTDYESVLKSLRYQLVAATLHFTPAQSTPRIEIQDNQSSLFPDDPWRVRIRLCRSDEQIIEESERRLANRLLEKGDRITRGELSHLLAEHLKSVEQLQHVTDSRKIQESSDSCLSDVRFSPVSDGSDKTLTPSLSEPDLAKFSEGVSVQSKLREYGPMNRLGKQCSNTRSNSGLPPIGRRNGNIDERVSASSTNALSIGANSDILKDPGESEHVQSSPESRAKNRKSLNESGIDSEGEDNDLCSFEDEEYRLNTEFVEAFYILWDTLTYENIRGLLAEYRKRQDVLFLPYEKTLKGNESKCIGEELSQIDTQFAESIILKRQDNRITFKRFWELLAEQMNRTKLIRVKSFEESSKDVLHGRSNSFNGFLTYPSFPCQNLLRLNTFSGSPQRSNSFVTQRQCSNQKFSGRQNAILRTRSRGSTSTASTSTSSGTVSDSDDRSQATKSSSVSREFSFGQLNEIEDIEEIEELGDSSTESSDKTIKPLGRMTNSRVQTATTRDRNVKRTGATQVHGLCSTTIGLAPTPTEPHAKLIADSMPKVEEIEGKLSLRGRPDSGIGVSTSSSSYSSSETPKEAYDIDEVISSSSEMREKVISVRAEDHNNLKSLVAAITKGFTSERHKAHAIYCWLVSQDLQHFSKLNKKSGSPAGKLRYLAEKKISHASLYIDLAKIAGLKCEKIDGYVKNNDYYPGNAIEAPKFQHAWVAVSMDGHYCFVDPQMGASAEKFFMDHYFVTSPDELVLSHFPKDKKWLLMNQSVTLEEFQGVVKTWPAMFKFQIRPLSMKSVIRTLDGRLSITVLLQNVAINPQLEYAGPGPKIDQDTLEEKIDHEIRDVDNAETYHVTLPQEGTYYFTAYAHVLEDGIDIPVFQYRIEYKDEFL